MRVDEAGGELLCDHCGVTYRFDQEAHCWTCDGPACPACLPRAPHPLCPECLGMGQLAGFEPMLASPSEMPPDPDAWSWEYKWDGIRTICLWDGRRHRLYSRNLLDITGGYPDLEGVGASLGGRVVALDGEIVALDGDAMPSFARLQRRLGASPSPDSPLVRAVPVYLFLFDVLFMDGEATWQRPFYERRRILEELGLTHPRARVPPSHRGLGREMMEAARRHGLEGVVAKGVDSPYEPGRRSRSWRKIKFVSAQAFVIGGWQPGGADGARVRSLLLGVHDSSGRLIYVGRVGTGLDEEQRLDLARRLGPLERRVPSFSNPPPRSGARFVLPTMVAQVEYRRWPDGGSVQQASFKGLRPDKPAHTVRREQRR